MKTLTTLFISSLITMGVFAQGPPIWNLHGNATTSNTADFIGTTNAMDLVFKVNNQSAVIIKGNTGGFRVVSLQGPGYGLVQADPNGELSRVNYPNNSSYVLNGAGSFVPISSLIPASPASGWSTTATLILSDPGKNVGIGTNMPTVTLEVVGDAKINGKLFVNDGIKVGDSSIHIFTCNSCFGCSDGVTDFSTGNHIYTDPSTACFTNGQLQINCQTNSPNTNINSRNGRVYLGTFENDGVYGQNIHPLFRAVVRQGLIITGKNGLLSWRSGTPGNPSPNTTGDIGICFEDRPLGDLGCTNPIKGLNFFRPFPHDAGFENWNLFISTLSGSAGNIGIGTPYPQHKLSVNGNIGAREVIVETNAWCDYVYEPGYKLMQLDSLREYLILNKKHPNFPSESEIIETGIETSVILKAQMKTIEEMTLYILQLEERLKNLEGKLEGLIENK